ncbi:MAG: leucyltransferase [Frankiales bacterium]|nr:leucyltransferase [Frankiales bacterium]
MPSPGDLFDAMDVAAQPRELVALGGDLSPAMLRAAYRNGVFPWPTGVEDEARQDRSLRRLARRGDVPLLPGTPEGPLVPWVSPHPRAVVVTHQVRVPRSLRQLLRRTGWETTLDQDFAQVIAACADRDSTWITPRMIAGYTALHREGDAHSLEVWDGDRLVGGLYGVLSGRVFSGESMFFRESGASKAAVLDTCRRLAEAGVPLLDTQQESEHLLAMGQVLVHRSEYVEAVRSLQGPAPQLPTERRLLVA